MTTPLDDARPNKEFAEAWATGDWAECKAESISLNKWHSRWIAVVIFPNQDEDGLVVFPDELDFELKQQAKKQR